MELHTLRLCQINILNVREGLAERYDLLGKHVQLHRLDVIAVQEVIEPELLEEKMKEAGLPYMAFADSLMVIGDNEPDCVGIASRYPIVNVDQIYFGEDLRKGVHCEMMIDDTNVHVLTAHFAWGSQTEGVRLRQAEAIDRLARSIRMRDSASAILFAGDLNAEGESRTARFFRGLDLGTSENSTYWLDAYIVAGKEEHWATSDHSQGILGPSTAIRFGVKLPEYLPARRIDYILSYGWQYGKIGCPVAFHRFGESLGEGQLELSDHFGLWADVLI